MHILQTSGKEELYDVATQVLSMLSLETIKVARFRISLLMLIQEFKDSYCIYCNNFMKPYCAKQLFLFDYNQYSLQVGKTHSFLYHSACIWGVEMYPDGVNNPAMPLGSFLTCSSDDTIRVWNLDCPEPQTNSKYRKNIYSNVSVFKNSLFPLF